MEGGHYVCGEMGICLDWCLVGEGVCDWREEDKFCAYNCLFTLDTSLILLATS